MPYPSPGDLFPDVSRQSGGLETSGMNYPRYAAPHPKRNETLTTPL